MPIVIVCPKCASHYRLDERYAGRKVVCRKCGFELSAPELPREGNAEADVVRFAPDGPSTRPSSGDSLFGEAAPAALGAGTQTPTHAPGLLDTQVNPAAPWSAEDSQPVDPNSLDDLFDSPPGIGGASAGGAGLGAGGAGTSGAAPSSRFAIPAKFSPPKDNSKPGEVDPFFFGETFKTSVAPGAPRSAPPPSARSAPPRSTTTPRQAAVQPKPPSVLQSAPAVDDDSLPVGFAPEPPEPGEAKNPGSDLDALASIEIESSGVADPEMPVYVPHRSYVWLYVAGGIAMSIGIIVAIVLASMPHNYAPPAAPPSLGPTPALPFGGSQPLATARPPGGLVIGSSASATPAPFMVSASSGAGSNASGRSGNSSPPANSIAVNPTSTGNPSLPNFGVLAATNPSAADSGLSDVPAFYSGAPTVSDTSSPAPWPSGAMHVAQPLTSVTPVLGPTPITEVLPTAIAATPSCVVAMIPGMAIAPAAAPGVNPDANGARQQLMDFQRFDAQSLASVGSGLLIPEEAQAQNIASPDGEYVVCLPTADSTTIHIYSVSQQKLCMTLNLSNVANGLPLTGSASAGNGTSAAGSPPPPTPAALAATLSPQLLGFYTKTNFAFSLITPAGPTIFLVDAQSGEKIRSELMPSTAMNGLAVESNGVHIAMASAEPDPGNINWAANPFTADFANPNPNGPPLTANLEIYNSQLGDWRRIAVGPVGQKAFSPAGLAFAPDGARVAMLCDDGISAVVRVWRLDDGRLLHTLIYPTLGLAAANGRDPRSLDFLSDSRTLAIRGMALVDSTSGHMIGRTGVDDANSQLVLPGDRLLVGNANDNWRVTNLNNPLPPVVDSGSDNAASAYPMAPSLPITSPLADWTVRAKPTPQPPTIPYSAPIPDATTNSTSAPTPSSPTPSSQALPIVDAIPLGAPQRVGPIFFTTDPAGQALAVHSANFSAGWQMDDPSHQWVDRIDLHSGVTLGSFDVPAYCTVLDISADGQTALLGAPGDFDAGAMQRLFLWSLEDRKLLNAWRPFAEEPVGEQTVAWARMLDAHHVMTQSNAGAMVLWSTKERLSQWRYGPILATPALSPSRNWVILRADGPLRLFDAMSGKLLGDLENVSDPSAAITDLTFSADGTRVAGMWHGGAAIWDLHSGGLAQNVTAVAPPVAAPVDPDEPTPATPPTVFGFGPGAYLMANDLLADVKRNAVAYTYSVNAGRHIAGPQDGRQWFVACSTPDQAWLCNTQLPSTADGKNITQFSAGPLAVYPGSAVSVDVKIDDSAASLTGSGITQNLLASLTAAHLKVAENASPIAVLHIGLLSTGDHVELRIADAPMPKGGWPRLAVQAWQCRATLQSADGAVLWDGGLTNISGGAAKVSVSPDELRNIDAAQLTNLYDGAMSASLMKWAATIPWPHYMTADGIVLSAPRRTLAAPDLTREN